MSASRSPPLPWPRADYCRTSPVFSFHFLPLGHIWSWFVASSKEGMQTCQPAAIPSVFQVDGLKGPPDDFGKLGEWVWGGSYVVMGREPSPASRGSPKPSLPLELMLCMSPNPLLSPQGTNTNSRYLISLRRWFPNLSGHQHPLGGLVKTQIAGHRARASDLVACSGA